MVRSVFRQNLVVPELHVGKRAETGIECGHHITFGRRLRGEKTIHNIKLGLLEAVQGVKCHLAVFAPDARLDDQLA